MGFHVVGSLSDGSSCDQSEVTVIIVYGGSSSEKEPLHSFRTTCHPAAALENSRLKKQPPCRFPTERSSTEIAAQQLSCLTLGETSSDEMIQTRHHPSHYFAADNTQSPHSTSSPLVQPLPVDLVAPVEERWSSPSLSPATGQSCASSSENPAVTRAHRARFLVFIKILFKSLENSNEHDLRDRAKLIVADCTRRNRLGDPQFSPLVEAVETRLRRVVGEAQWRKASFLLRHFAAKQNGLPGEAS